MVAKHVLFVFGCLLLGGSPGPAAADPAPKEMPVIKCELKATGKIGDIERADGGEVVITNISGETVDIGTKIGPLGFLELKVKDAKGQAIKTEPAASFASPFEDVQPHPLKPGESYRSPFGLLFTVPREKRVAGTYKVKAVFTFKMKEYESAEVEVKWPGEKK